MDRRDDRKVSDWGWLALAILVLSLVFGTIIAYFLETLPSADPPHALIVGRFVGLAIAFTLMIGLLFVVAIPATRYWDRQVSAWEALICLTTVMIAAPATVAVAEHLGAEPGSALVKVLAFVLAIAGFVLTRWLYRRWRPPVPREEGRFRYGDWWR